MPAYPNPFAHADQLDAGMRALAKGFFAGPSPAEEAEKAALNEYRAAQAARAAAEKTKAEREAEEIARRLTFSTPDAMDTSVGASLGIPAARVRAVRSIPSGPSPTGMPPAVDPRAREIGERLFALHTHYGSGRGTTADVAKADDIYSTGRSRAAVLSGDADPTRVGQAFFATSGKAPFDFTTQGTGNLATGDFTLSPVGESEASENLAQADKARREAHNLSRGFFGPETFVDDGAGNVVPRFLGQVAGSDTAAAAPRPVAPRQPTPRQPPNVTPDVSGDFDAEINRQLGVRLDKDTGEVLSDGMPLRPEVMARVRARAIDLYRQSGNAASAVAHAIQELGPLENETTPGTLWGENDTGFRRPRAALPPALEPQAMPPQARAMLREGVVTTFRNGSKWTLRNGVAVQVP